MITEPLVLCQYCDDVRFEINNKISYIGVFNSELRITGKLPVTIPKIVASASVLLPLDFKLDSLQFQLNWNGKIIQDVSLPSSECQQIVAEASTKSTKHGVEPRGLHFQCALAVTPFIVDAAGVLRFDALINGIQHKANSLMVEIAEVQPTVRAVAN